MGDCDCNASDRPVLIFMAIGDLLLFISTKSARVSDSAWQASTSNISALAAIVTLVASRASGDKVGAVISFPRRGTTTTSVRRTRRIIVASDLFTCRVCDVAEYWRAS